MYYTFSLTKLDRAQRSLGSLLPSLTEICWHCRGRVSHSIFNPWDDEKSAHCIIPGSMDMAPIEGACADYIMDDAVDSDPTKWTGTKSDRPSTKNDGFRI